MNLVSSEGNWTKTKFAMVKDQKRQLRERNVDAIFLFAENLMRLFRKKEDKNYWFIFCSTVSFLRVYWNQFTLKRFQKQTGALLLTRLTALREELGLKSSQ